MGFISKCELAATVRTMRERSYRNHIAALLTSPELWYQPASEWSHQA